MHPQMTHDDLSDAPMPTPSSPASPATTASPAPLRAAPVERPIDRLFAVVERIWAPLLRISLAVILIWIGAIKFANPAPIVALLNASPLYGVLATNGFVYALGVLELVAAGFLLANRAVRYVGLLAVLLFAGTFSIFLTAPAVTFGTPQGLPVLSLAGQFLLKDLGLAAAALAAVAHDVQRRRAALQPAADAR